jgi:hypothetical protein
MGEKDSTRHGGAGGGFLAAVLPPEQATRVLYFLECHAAAKGSVHCACTGRVS